MAIGTVPTYLQNASHSAAIFRVAQSAPFTSGGILSSVELGVTQQGSPNMSVVLGPGRAQIVGTSVSPPAGQTWTTQAQYTAYNDANLTLTIAASNPTNPRIDAVYIQIQDSFYSGATNTAVAAVATGTPAVSPAAPAIPANSILIAYVAVAANATSIVTANITSQTSLASLLQQQQFLGEAQSASSTTIPSTSGTNVADANAPVTFTLTQTTRVRIHVRTLLNTNGAGSLLQLKTGVVAGSTATLSGATISGSLTQMYLAQTGGPGQTTAVFESTVLLAAGTYTAFPVGSQSGTTTASSLINSYTSVIAIGYK